MFRPAIRNEVEKLCFELEAMLKGLPNLNEEFLTVYSAIDDEHLLVGMLDDFGKSNNDIVIKHLKFINPSQFRSGDMLIASINFQTPLGEFVSFFEDFVNATSRIFLSFKYKYEKQKYFREAWERLNTEFFSDQIEVTFRAILFQFNYSGGGGIVEDLIPDSNLVIRWQGRDPDGELIVRQLEDAVNSEMGRLERYSDNIMRRPYNFIEYKFKVDKDSSLDAAFESAREVFEKVTYLIRLLSRGGAHYSSIIGSYEGNRMGTKHMAVYEPLNQLFLPLETSNIGWPELRAYQNAWAKIKPKKIDDFMFQNQKFRDYAQTKKLGTASSYGLHYKLTIRLEQILDFVQIIESSIGEFGLYNAEYLDKIHDKNLQEKFETLINLRHKYVHGLSEELNTILTEAYGDQMRMFDQLDSDIESLAYITKQTVLKSIINTDIKEKLLEYHLDRGRRAFGHRTRRPNPSVDFPELISIWHE